MSRSSGHTQIDSEASCLIWVGFLLLPVQICLDDKATEKWMRDQDYSLVVEPQDVQEWAVVVPVLVLTLPVLPQVPAEIVKGVVGSVIIHNDQ